MTIKQKLLSSYLFIACLTAIVGYLGYGSLHATKSLEATQFATKDLLLQTLGELENMRHYVQTEDLEKLYELDHIQTNSDEIREMWIAALVNGSESKEFKEDESYKLWQTEGYLNQGILIPYNEQIKSTAEEIDELNEQYEEVEEEIRDLHKEKQILKNSLQGLFEKEKQSRTELISVINQTRDITLLSKLNDLLSTGKSSFLTTLDAEEFQTWLNDIQKIYTHYSSEDTITYIQIKNLSDKYYADAKSFVGVSLEIDSLKTKITTMLLTVDGFVHTQRENEEIIAAQILSLVQKQEKRTTLLLVSFVIISLILASILEALLYRSITIPFKKLIIATDTFANGNLDTRVEIASKDEFKDLGNAFNHMAEYIESSTTSIANLNNEIDEKNRIQKKLYSAMYAIESSTDAIAMADVNHNHVFQNKAYTDTFGYSLEEIQAIGGGAALFTNKLKIKEVVKTILEGKSWSDEIQMLTKNGDSITVLLRIDTIYNTDGERVGVIGIHTDITERKKAEQELKDAKITAEIANNSKTQFLSNMSHEIRTPMNGVMGMTSLLSSTELTQDQRNFVESIQSSGDSLLVLINDILDYTKIQSGKMEVEPIEFNLLTTLGDFADTIAPRAHEKSLELICAPDSDVPEMVIGDPGRIRQVLSNIVSNAIKFTDHGEILIRVSRITQGTNHCMLRFSVRDTGIGITQAQKTEIFNTFTQTDESTTRAHGGTGIGLAISKQLVTMMHGEIGVDSEFRAGSEFWFTIRVQVTKQPIQSVTSSHLQGKKVAIIESSSTSCEIMEALLSSWGMNTTSVNSYDDWIESYNQNDELLDLIIVDSEVADQDNNYQYKKLRNDTRFDSTKIVILTAVGTHGDAMRFQKAQINGYLTKPIRSCDLLGVISYVLGENSRAAGIITRHSVRESLTPQKGLKGHLNTTTILLVDDNRVNQLVATKILELLGYAPEVVSNGKEAVEALSQKEYDIVLMDCQMPVMDGYEASEVIRDPQSTVKNHSVSIIAMTANALQGDREKCITAGMDDYITKPIDPLVLKDKLAKWLTS